MPPSPPSETAGVILEPAVVLESADGVARVRCLRQAGCARCAEGRGCGGGIFGRLLGDRLHVVEALYQDPAPAPGSEVVIGLPESAVLGAAVVQYLLPLLTMLVGAVLGSAVTGGGDAAAVAGAATGLLAGLWHARRFGRLKARDPRFRPRVLPGLESAELPGGGCRAEGL